jgi:type VI secretion system secreted protein Hcp
MGPSRRRQSRDATKRSREIVGQAPLAQSKEPGMASDIFAKITNIKGESDDAKHKDEIDVLSWTWGVTQSGTMAHGGGGGGGKASFHDLTFTHHIDKASALLLKACATGSHIPEATITVRKAGKGQQEYLIIRLSDVLITSVAMSVAGDEPTTAENVTLQAGKVDYEYKAQKADGSLEPSLHFKYDIKANKVA